MFSHTRLFRQDLLVASLFRNFLLVERIMRFANCSPISYPMLPPTHQHHKWDAWDMAAEICLAQLPALVEDPNAEFQAVRSGGNGNAVEANPCLSSDEKPEIEVDVDGSLPFYILDSHEEFYGANAGSLYLFGKNDIVTKLERDAEESKISPTTFSTKLHCFGAFSY